MPAPVPAFADLRSAIDPEETYVVQMDDGSGWARPAAEHAHLTGVDVLHAVRRGLKAYRLELGTGPRGIITLTSGPSSVRFIPHRVYQDTVCAAEDCEESTEDGEGWDGLCGNCADRAYTDDNSGPDQDDAPSALPASAPAALPAAVPYTPGDLRQAAAAAYQMVLLSLDSDCGVGEGICDHAIPSSTGTDSERTWQSLGDQAGDAYRAMHRLIDAAPDLSRWAIDMAADHLTPDAEPLTHRHGDQPAATVHLAFAADITEDQRAALRQALLLVLHTAL